MFPTQSKNDVISEAVFEIRFKPNPKVLDFRGVWAEQISKHMNLSEWRIDTNLIEIHDKKVLERIIVSYRNVGLLLQNTRNQAQLLDNTTKLLRFLFTLNGFGQTLNVQRIGVRQRFCSTFEGTFESLRQSYLTRYLNITDLAKRTFNADLVDIGGPLNFTDGHGNFNTMSGPMRSEQIKEYFEKRDEYPSVGFYFDIDYWQKPDKELDVDSILRIIKPFSEQGWEKHEKIRALVVEVP